MTRQINTGSNPAYLELVQNYPTLADFPSPDPSTLGDLSYAEDTQITYVSEGGAWVVVGGGGSGGFVVVPATSDITADFGQLIDGDASAGAFSAMLPVAAAVVNGKNTLAIKSETPSNFAITVVPAGADTIDGETSLVLPPGTYLYLVSDGVSNWISISYNKLPYIDVTAFPGADLGAQIQNADAFLGSTPGTLFVPDGNYTWSTHCTQLHVNRTLQFGAGIITCIGQNPFFFPYPGPMAILNDNTTVLGQGAATIFDEPDSSVLFAPLTSAGFTNVHFRDFTVQNIANTAPLQLGTSLPNIGFDNSADSSAIGIVFVNTRSLSISTGGSSAGGNHANGVTVTRCLFDGVKCITLACVNGQNISYDHNTFKNVGAVGPGAPYAAIACIDMEPNTGTDLMQNCSVSDNIFDMSNNSGGSCILYQGAGVGTNGVIANNVIKCGTDASLGTTAGITVNGQTDVLVEGNVITGQFSLQLPVDINGCVRATFTGNTIISSGGPLSGFRCVIVRGGSVDTTVSNNVISVPVALVGWASIADDNTCSGTMVFGNRLTGVGTVPNPLPTIELSGTGDQQWGNILNGVVQGDALVLVEDFQLATGSGTENQGSATYADITSYPTATFAVPYDGEYEIFARLKGIYSTGAQGEFRLMVDGVAVATTVDQYPFGLNAYLPVILRGKVTLTAGNRVVKAQWRNVNGAGLNLDQTIAGVTYGSRTYGIRN